MKKESSSFIFLHTRLTRLLRGITWPSSLSFLSFSCCSTVLYRAAPALAPPGLVISYSEVAALLAFGVAGADKPSSAVFTSM